MDALPTLDLDETVRAAMRLQQRAADFEQLGHVAIAAMLRQRALEILNEDDPRPAVRRPPVPAEPDDEPGSDLATADLADGFWWVLGLLVLVVALSTAIVIAAAWGVFLLVTRHPEMAGWSAAAGVVLASWRIRAARRVTR